MLTVQIESNRYDDATLRLCYASSLLTTLSILFDAEEGADTPSKQVLSSALYGIKTLIEDAQQNLN